jgi:hypothetical protein
MESPPSAALNSARTIKPIAKAARPSNPSRKKMRLRALLIIVNFHLIKRGSESMKRKTK